MESNKMWRKLKYENKFSIIFCLGSLGYSRAKQVDEPAEAELVHVVDGGQVVAGEVQLHRELGQILKFKWPKFIQSHFESSCIYKTFDPFVFYVVVYLTVTAKQRYQLLLVS